MSVLDTDLLTALQYATLNPPDDGATWLDGLWTPAEVLAYLNERQNRLLRETLLLVGQAAPIAVATGVSQVTLPDDWMRTVRLIWRGTDGITRALFRSDSFAADAAVPTWETTPDTPLVYLDQEKRILSLIGVI